MATKLKAWDSCGEGEGVSRPDKVGPKDCILVGVKGDFRLERRLLIVDMQKENDARERSIARNRLQPIICKDSN
jgi:hypothetical protein